jgi:hypothetical protein
MGFGTPNDYFEFMRQCPEVERTFARSGIILIKLWFPVSRDEQLRRFAASRNLWAEANKRMIGLRRNEAGLSSYSGVIGLDATGTIYTPGRKLEACDSKTRDIGGESGGRLVAKSRPRKS